MWPSVHVAPKPSAPRRGSQRRPGIKNRWQSELCSLTRALFIFAPGILGSHLLKHLKNTLISAAAAA